MCASLAATYLTVEPEGTPLESDFRRRAAAAGLVAGAAAIASLLVAPFAAPSLAGSLFGRRLPLLILALVNGPLPLVAVCRSAPRLARFAAALPVTFVRRAYAVGQWPRLG